MAEQPKVTPATSQQLPGNITTFRNQPNAFESIALGLSRGMANERQREAQEQQNLASSFPSLIASGAVSPYNKKTSEGEPIQFGGMEWGINSQGVMNLGTEKKQLEIEKLKQDIANKYGISNNKLLGYAVQLAAEQSKNPAMMRQGINFDVADAAYNNYVELSKRFGEEADVQGQGTTITTRQEDLEFTARKHNITVEEVIRRENAQK